ncbi:MAG: hypothetical protein DA330_09555 [Nitrososphaera sp.]|nr:hypothetical protein [Nitrososphaera sp.]
MVVRLSDPENQSIRIDTIPADEGGNFAKQIITWPQPSRNFVYGNYTLEVSSGTFPNRSETFTVVFTNNKAVAPNSPESNVLSVKLDSPTEVSTGKPFRIFIQVTFDEALVNIRPEEILQVLGSSHIHSGDSTINLSDKINKLHEGLYYADVVLDKEGAFVIHAVAFYQGFLANDSKVISSGSSIEDIQTSIDQLSEKLDRTQEELDKTSQTLNETRTVLDASVKETRASIEEDILQAKQAVEEMKEASGQINSIILPILALASVIIALQLSLFARIRASYK